MILKGGVLVGVGWKRSGGTDDALAGVEVFDDGAGFLIDAGLRRGRGWRGRCR